jgi:hypothetical protein
LTGEFWYPQNFALELDEILPLLTDEVPIQAIWEVVEQYVHTLFEGHSFPADSPDLNAQPSHDSPSRAIADLLILHIDHPVFAVAQASQRTCTKLLLQRDLAVQSAIHEGLEKTESQQEQILMILDAVSRRDPNAVVPFRNKILSLYQSSNYAIRHAAQIIGRRLGYEQTVAAPHPIPLPAIYRLSFPQRSTGMLIDLEMISGEEPLSDSDDPMDIIRAVVPTVDLIAEKARLPKMNMYHRTAQLMRQLAPLSSWSEDGEKQLRSTLNSTGLRLIFHRPRAVLARRAMFHIVAELIDAHVLGSHEVFQLDPVLRFYDPHMFLLEPVQRPSSVAPIEGKNRLGGINETWLEQVTQAADSTCCKTDDGLIVLAEETTLKWLEWSTPTEVRRSGVVQSSILYPEDSDSFFSKVVNRLVSEYPFLSSGIATPSLILRHSDFIYDSPGKNWLALNPTIGSHLGWSVAEDGLFRWVNNAGQTMVESIWWTDSLVGQVPPHFDDEVGEGWLVVASQAAWDTITSQPGTLKHMIHVERRLYNEGERLRCDVHAEWIVGF